MLLVLLRQYVTDFITQDLVEVLRICGTSRNILYGVMLLKLFFDEVEKGLKVDTKFSYEDVQLTHYSVMNIRLVAQTLNTRQPVS